MDFKSCAFSKKGRKGHLHDFFNQEAKDLFRSHTCEATTGILFSQKVEYDSATI